MRKFEKGIYIATDVRWGMALDLSCGDFRSLIAYGFHGAENQQARYFLFLTLRGYCAEEADCFVAVKHDRPDPPGPRALRRGLTIL